MIFSFILFTSATLVPKKEKTISREIPTVENSTLHIPFLQKDFVGFKEALAFKESRGRYTVVNTLGYMGKYQFGKTTLQRLRIYNSYKFLHTPELQEAAFVALCKINKWILRKDIKRSVGKTMNGVKVTESGILAAAHLSGAGNVKKYLRSSGHQHFADAYGTTIKTYMKKFSGYDVSAIEANKKAKLHLFLLRGI